MIRRGLSILTILSSCVLSLPLAPSQLENADVQVMKCIIEALADELSRPHSNPVSQECLETLREDDRLVSVLRHHNFLKELQEIALKGVQERAQLQKGEDTSYSTTPSPQPTSDVVDRSMLEALGGPGERSILSPKRTTGHEGHEEEKDDSSEDGESQEDNNTITEEVQAKRENDERPGSHISEPENEWSEGKTEKREEEESDLNSEEKPEEEHMAKEKKGSRPGEKKDAHRNKSKEMKSDEEEKEKRSVFSSHKQQQKQQGEDDDDEEEGETKRGGMESVRRWTKRGHVLALKKKAVKKDLQQHTSQEMEVPHHSKEESDETEEKTKRNWHRSPEEKELRMIARSGPEERRGSEEEGSAIRKSEEPEIESLAAIESELENVAQKLHELRRG